MRRDRTVMASCVLSDDVARQEALVSRRFACLSRALEGLAAKKGRVIAYPSIRMFEDDVDSMAARLVTVAATTVAKPGWRKPRKEHA